MGHTHIDDAANNDAPVAVGSIANQYVAEDVPWEFALPSGLFADSDPGDVLTYSMQIAGWGGAQGMPTWLTFDPVTLTFHGTPIEGQGVSVQVKATDRAGAYSTQQFSVSVVPTNHAPTLAEPLDDCTISEGDYFSYGFPAKFYDPDGESLFYTATLVDGSPLPSWLLFDGPSQSFWGTAATDSGTQLNIRLTATDPKGLSTYDDFTLTVQIEDLVLTGTSAHEYIDGRSGNDRLSGLAGSDTLSGNAGNDILDGGAGADTMNGGTGDDTYVVDSAYDRVNENANEGVDTVQASVTLNALAANVENLILTGAAAINGTGNDLDNVLTGNGANNRLTGGAGNDLLDGGSGNDTMVGGLGDHIYIVSTTQDVVTESTNQGFDTVRSSVTLTTASNVEGLVLTGTSAINATGNTLNNWLVGNSAINTLKGAGGNDVIEGGAGNDIINDTSGRGYFNGGSGNDTITGGSSAEILVGSVGNDTITAGSGADVILFNMGDGADIVNGGTGTDNTLSLGGGIRYEDLRFRKSSSGLVLEIGGESLTFKNWYTTSANNKSVAKLQCIVEASSDYAPGSGNALVDHKVEQFNFAGLVTAFDQARTANPALTSWALTNALATYHLGASSGDTAAIGGDLAYYYGRNGSLAGINVSAAQDVIGSSTLGTQNQTLRAFETISGQAAALS